MSLKKRVQDLEVKVHSTAKPKPGIVRVCGSDTEIRQAENELAALPEGTSCVILHEIDCSVPRMPKGEK